MLSLKIYDVLHQQWQDDTIKLHNGLFKKKTIKFYRTVIPEVFKAQLYGFITVKIITTYLFEVVTITT